MEYNELCELVAEIQELADEQREEAFRYQNSKMFVAQDIAMGKADGMQRVIGIIKSKMGISDRLPY